jgi:hypothetical protein
VPRATFLCSVAASTHVFFFVLLQQVYTLLRFNHLHVFCTRQGGHIKRYIMQGIRAGRTLLTAVQICAYLKENSSCQPKKGGKLERRHFEVIEMAGYQKSMRPQGRGCANPLQEGHQGHQVSVWFLLPVARPRSWAVDANIIHMR